MLLKKSFYLMLTLFISGCGMMKPIPVKAYKGPLRPLSEIASVAAGPIGGVEITQADETDTYLDSAGGIQHTIGIHLLPGKHKLLFVYRGNWKNVGPILKFDESKKSIEVSVEAGHSYIPKANVRWPVVDFSLEDKGLGYNQNCLVSEIRDQLPSGC